MIGRRDSARVHSATVAAAASDEPSNATAMSERPVTLGDRLRSPQTIISFVVAFAIIFFVFRNLDLNFREIWQNVRTANPLPIVAAFIVYYGSFPLRSARWRIILRNAGISDATGFPVPGLFGLSQIYCLSWFANCLVPAKLGDAYRGYLLKKHAQPSFGRTIGTIFAERVMDVFALVGLMLLATLLVFHGSMPSSIQAPVFVGVGLVIVGVGGLAVMFRYGHAVQAVVPERVRPYYIRTQEGLRTSFSRKGAVWVVALTLAVWFLEGLRVWLVAAAFAVYLSPQDALFVALLASLLTVVPLTPAGLGIVEGGTIVALKLLGVSALDAGSIAIVDRVVAYWSVILFGGVLYLFTRYK
jgi:uncharacterized protein (TIRG00374 family)